MAGNLDHAGRPVVAVTGLGVVTSLGRGKAENWTKLTEGRSGIHTITRFPTEGLRTRITGTADFRCDAPVAAPVLSERLATLAAEEAVEQAGIGAKGNFPGPLFCAGPPVEGGWAHRRGVACE